MPRTTTYRILLFLASFSFADALNLQPHERTTVARRDFGTPNSDEDTDRAHGEPEPSTGQFQVVERAGVLMAAEVILQAQRGDPIDIGSLGSALQQVTSYFGNRLSQQGLPTQVKPVVLISQPRSGSSMMCTLLDSHPDIVFAEAEPYVNLPNFTGSIEEALDAMFDKVVQSTSQQTDGTVDTDTKYVKWFGIKVQVCQLKDVEGGLVVPDADITFILHWRRNVLRMCIASEASRQDPAYKSHTISSEEASEIASFKPAMKASGLVCAINCFLRQHSRILKQLTRYGARVCPISHYEEWITPQTRSAVERRTLECLGAAVTDLSTRLVPVHTLLPLLDTVANPLDVNETLVDTTFAYMLENEGTDDLLRSDSFDQSNPHGTNCYDDSQFCMDHLSGDGPVLLPQF